MNYKYDDFAKIWERNLIKWQSRTIPIQILFHRSAKKKQISDYFISLSSSLFPRFLSSLLPSSDPRRYAVNTCCHLLAGKFPRS